MYVCTYVCIHIYIYIYRERERDIEIYCLLSSCLFLFMLLVLFSCLDHLVVSCVFSSCFHSIPRAAQPEGCTGDELDPYHWSLRVCNCLFCLFYDYYLCDHLVVSTLFATTVSSETLNGTILDVTFVLPSLSKKLHTKLYRLAEQNST